MITDTIRKSTEQYRLRRMMPFVSVANPAFNPGHLCPGQMPRSHIHGSPRRFHSGSNLTDYPGNAIFLRPIRMHNGVATGFGVSTKDKIEK